MIDTVVRSQRKTIALVIDKDACLIVRAPFRVPLAYLEELVRKKQSWIEERKQHALASRGVSPKKNFVDGEFFLFLGEKYPFQTVFGKKIELTDKLLFPRKFLVSKEKRIVQWYKEMAYIKIQERAKYYSTITGWKYTTFNITSAETRWGSCSSRGSINFAWKLVMAPLEAIDYVVVHELAHINEKNHSIRFWNAVEGVLPEYKQQQTWLKENQKFLTI